MSLIPQLVLVFKKRNADQISWVTALMTATSLWVMTFVFLSMKYWFTSCAEMAQAICWTLLLAAKIKFSRSIENWDTTIHFGSVKNPGASPEAFRNMNSESHETKPKQASGYQSQRE